MSFVGSLISTVWMLALLHTPLYAHVGAKRFRSNFDPISYLIFKLNRWDWKHGMPITGPIRRVMSFLHFRVIVWSNFDLWWAWTNHLWHKYRYRFMKLRRFHRDLLIGYKIPFVDIRHWEIVRKNPIPFVIFIVTLCLGFPLMVGATYYVDPDTGSNSNNGLSEGAALLNLNGVTSGMKVAGNYILVKEGTTMTLTDSVSNTSSGSIGSPITWGTYGSSTTPVINANGSQFCFWIFGADYNYYENLSFTGWSNKCFFIDASGYNTGLSFVDLTLDGITAFYMYHCEDFVAENIDMTTTGGGSWNIQGTSSSPNQNILVSGGTIDATGSTDVINIHKVGSSHNGANIVMYNVTAGGGSEEVIDCEDGTNVRVIGCNFTGRVAFQDTLNVDSESSYCHFAWNVVYGNPNIICNRVKFYGNAVIGDARNLFVDSYSGDSNNCHDAEIVYNTFLNTDGGVAIRYNDAAGVMNASPGIRFKSNIIDYQGSAPSSMHSFGNPSNFGPNSTYFECDYNIYHGTFSGGGVNWSYWNATYGHDTHGANADPMLVDRTLSTNTDHRDLYIGNASSPAIDLAEAISTGTYYDNSNASMTGIVKDFNGDSRE